MGASRTRVGIVGLGRMGSLLASALGRAQRHVLVGAASRHPQRTRGRGLVDARLDARFSAAELAGMVDVLVLCVPDDTVASVAAGIAEALTAAAADNRDSAPRIPLAVTVSGSVALAQLAPLADTCGWATGRVHPLLSVTPATAVEELAGVETALTAGAGGRETERRLRVLARDLRLTPLVIREADRVAWHAAASIAANFPVTLLAEARDLAVRAGVEPAQALDALSRLAVGALRQAALSGPESALTGPISRGDSTTVAAHLQLLDELGDPFARTYAELGRATVAFAQRSERVDDAAAARVMDVLQRQLDGAVRGA